MPFVQDNAGEKIKQLQKNDPSFRRAFNIAEQEHKIVSQIIKERKRIGLTQRDFASKLGIKQQAVSTFERVEESPTLKRLVQLAGALDMEVRIVKKRRVPVKGFKVYRKHNIEPVKNHEDNFLIHK